MALLSERELDEAYLAAKPGEKYLLFFTDGGAVGLDLQNATGAFTVRWVNINSGEWGPTETVQAPRVAQLAAPGPGPWAAAIVRSRGAQRTARPTADL
ncbi:MAG: hypothetical protein FJ387_27770 [Verrucomicrobia bacterium]|nr:hypothetical protein [Verrucomicrobiota bacterium]